MLSFVDIVAEGWFRRCLKTMIYEMGGGGLLVLVVNVDGVVVVVGQ